MPARRMTLGAAHGFQLLRLKEHANHRFVTSQAILLKNIETPRGRTRNLHLLKGESDRMADSISKFCKIFWQKPVRSVTFVASHIFMA